MSRHRFDPADFCMGDIVKLDGKPGEFLIEFMLGEQVWVYALGPRPKGFVRDSFQPSFLLRPLVGRPSPQMELA